MQKQYPIKTNFEDLDIIIGGLFPGELMVIGSRPAIGKTSFLVTLIKKITFGSFYKGLLFSLELSSEFFRERLASSFSGISINKIRATRMGNKTRPGLSKDESKIYKKVLSGVYDLPLIIDDTENKKIDDICDSAREIFFREKGIDIIYIDYLGLISTNNYKASLTDVVAEIVTKLKQLARELNIPIVTTCQASRSAEPVPPRPSDLTGRSGIMIDNADVIILLDRKRPKTDFYSYQDVTLYIAKNSFGETGEVKLEYNAATLSYECYPSSIKNSLDI